MPSGTDPGRPGNTCLREDQILPSLAAFAILLAGDSQAQCPMRPMMWPRAPRLAIQNEPLDVPHAVVLIDRHPPAALRPTGAS